ncbi:MAG: helix-turn-helix transcriptional regulator [Actinobacteria bacterium]|nr:helix-turn-helix transcriptional regulator [Actinomycetota bacterium]
MIREARLRAGLTQAELAEKSGRDRTVVARWEQGLVAPSVDTLVELVQACGFDRRGAGRGGSRDRRRGATCSTSCRDPRSRRPAGATPWPRCSHPAVRLSRRNHGCRPARARSRASHERSRPEAQALKERRAGRHQRRCRGRARQAPSRAAADSAPSSTGRCRARRSSPRCHAEHGRGRRSRRSRRDAVPGSRSAPADQTPVRQPAVVPSARADHAARRLRRRRPCASRLRAHRPHHPAIMTLSAGLILACCHQSASN